MNGQALRWTLGEDDSTRDRGVRTADNPFFRDLYRNVAAGLKADERFLHRLEAGEHTAQVDNEQRQEREERFRAAELPVLFCSPTMELGVDIAELNTVYMRNLPPTPANYAQRSGRAGRSGQPALVLAYAAAKSPTTSTSSAIRCAWSRASSPRRRSISPTRTWSAATFTPSGWPKLVSGCPTGSPRCSIASASSKCRYGPTSRRR